MVYTTFYVFFFYFAHFLEKRFLIITVDGTIVNNGQYWRYIPGNHPHRP